MGRPREFDEDEVLDQALGVFWEHGFAATSISHLTEATGLTKGSLYKAFEDKRSLFLRALDRYLTNGVATLTAVADRGSPLEALRNWLTKVLELATCDGVRRGCWAVNCAIELAPHDAAVRARIGAHEAEVQGIYAKLIRRAIAAGELPSGINAAAAARWISTTIHGLQVRGKLGLDRKLARETVSMTLHALAGF